MTQTFIAGPGQTAPTLDRPNAATAPADSPRELHAWTVDDWMSLAGSLLGSLTFVWVLYYAVLPFSGIVGFLICWYFAFLAMYAGVTLLSHARTVAADRLVAAAVSAAALMVAIAVGSTVLYVFVRGWAAYTHLNFITKTMAGVGPQDPLSHGGVLHAIVGTGVEIGIGVFIALPLGIGTAIFMTEVGGPFARVTRTVVEAMTALPDIVAGLFIYTVLIIGVHIGPIYIHVGRTGFAAAMALTVMMTPIIARSADVALRVVPGGLREAGLALGASQWRTVWRVVLPTARSGLATAVILGVARGVGETAPVLLTSGASTFFNWHPLRDPMNSLPLFIFSAVRSGENTYIERGFGAASVLLFLVLVLFVVMRLLARPRRGNR